MRKDLFPKEKIKSRKKSLVTSPSPTAKKEELKS